MMFVKNIKLLFLLIPVVVIVTPFFLLDKTNKKQETIVYNNDGVIINNVCVIHLPEESFVKANVMNDSDKKYKYFKADFALDTFNNKLAGETSVVINDLPAHTSKTIKAKILQENIIKTKLIAVEKY